MTVEQVFTNVKETENGDISFKSTTNKMLDILFMTEYYQKNLDDVPYLGSSDENRLFSMFIRDPRFGLGRRDLGRLLMSRSECTLEQIIKAGRIDDLFYSTWSSVAYPYLKSEIEKGNELVKKWMPRYSSKNLMLAREIARSWGMNKQQYGKFIKCDSTVESKLSHHKSDEINFEHVPSLAMIKYSNRFSKGEDTKERYKEYLNDVRSGKKDMKVSTTTVYDIYKNRAKIDCDLFFDKLEKISINCVPVVDTSGSMWDGNDSIGKALSVGHYLSKCSTYMNGKVVSFSSNPELITLGEFDYFNNDYCEFYGDINEDSKSDSVYRREIASMYTGDCSNTDLGKVMDLFKMVDDVPEYIVILSDMEFDRGSKRSKDELMKLWKEKGYKTKIVWWNFNSRSTTCPEMDSEGNIFMSGYNPMLLKYLSVGFNGEEFLKKLLEEYKKNIS
jgi:hypothetical protein